MRFTPPAGCEAWDPHAAELESEIKVLIVAARTVDDLADEVRSWIHEREEAAEAEVERPRTFARFKEQAWRELEATIHQSRNLAATCGEAGPEERRILLDY